MTQAQKFVRITKILRINISKVELRITNNSTCLYKKLMFNIPFQKLKKNVLTYEKTHRYIERAIVIKRGLKSKRIMG